MDAAPIARSDIPRAVEALAVAFHDDHVYGSLWPDPARRARALRAFMAVPLTDAHAHGRVIGVTARQRVLAAAAWLPAGRFPLAARRKARTLPRLGRVALADPRAFGRLTRFGSNVEAAFPDDRPAYLAVIGVVPDAQGQGLGTAVLEQVLGLCDATGSDCYLETASPRAERLYERVGFSVLSAGDQLLPGGPTHWRMRRPGL